MSHTGLCHQRADEVYRVAKTYLASATRPATFVDELCPSGRDLTVAHLSDSRLARETKYMILHDVWQEMTKVAFPDLADPGREIRGHRQRALDPTQAVRVRPYAVPCAHTRRTWAFSRASDHQVPVPDPAPDHVFGPFGTPTRLETALGAWVFTVRLETPATVWNSGMDGANDRSTGRPATFDAANELIDASWTVLLGGLRTHPYLLAHISAMLRAYKSALDKEWQSRRDQIWRAVKSTPCFGGFFKEGPALAPQRWLQRMAALAASPGL